MFPWKMLQSSKGNGDRWIDMCPGDVTRGEYNYHDCQAGGDCQAKKGLRALCLLVHNSCGCACENEYEGTYKLSSHLV